MPDDDIAGDVGGGSADPGSAVDDPTSGGSPDGGEVDLEQIAADFDAEAMAALGEEQPPADGKGEGKGKGRPSASSDPVDDFIQKNYQGDRAAFVASLYESRQEQRRQADEIAVLKSQRTPVASRDAAADFKAARDQDPDIQALDQEIAGLVAEDTSLARRQLEVATRAGQLNSTIARIEGELTHAEADARPKLISDLTSARSEIMSLQSEWNVNENTKRTNASLKRTAQRDLSRMEREIRDGMANQENEAKQGAAFATKSRQMFASAFNAHASNYGLDVNAPKYRILQASCRATIADYLDSLGDDADGFDAAGMYEAVGRLMSAAAKEFGLTPKGAKPRPRPSPRALSVPTHRGGNGAGNGKPGSRSPTPDDVLEDPNLIRKRADAIFSALGRQSAGGRTGLA